MSDSLGELMGAGPLLCRIGSAPGSSSAESIDEPQVRASRDAERGYRVEGVFELASMNEPPRSRATHEGALQVAGACSLPLAAARLPRVPLAA